MCPRNYRGGLENKNLPLTDIDLAKFKLILPAAFIQQLSFISFCGNFGDPIVNNSLIDIVTYVSETNPDITVNIHTNGSARSEQWWKDLAYSLPIKHIVEFGIDGLQDTHSLYRIGTDYNKIISNASAFIQAGGKAQWNFIKFKHNQHQIDDARTLALRLGFESFRVRDTSRFVGSSQYAVYDKTGNTDYHLELPTEHVLNFIDNATVKNYKELFKGATVTCEVAERKEIYIDAQMQLWPCCYTASVPYTFVPDSDITKPYHDHSKDSIDSLVKSLGGYEKINLQFNSIESILNSVEWQTNWKDYWMKEKLPTCSRTCGNLPNYIVTNSKTE
jgi:MoaA/NifB/PqqE/SkfB family radical SAM enzyme